MRRLLVRFALSCGVLFAALTLVSCGDGRASLVIYSPHGEELLRAYEEAFEAEHPDIDVQWLDMGSQDVLDRLRTERNNPQASLWWGAPQALFVQAAAEGLLEPYAPTWAGAVPPDARDGRDRWFGTYLTPEVIAYNSDAVDSTAVPADWDALLDPAWRGRLLIRSPLASGTMRAIFGAMILRQPTVEEGYRWLARLDMNTVSYPADPTQLYLKLSRGEGDLTLWNMPDIYLQRLEHGYPFAYRLPASGTPVIVEGIALVSGAPAQEQAKLFYEFVTTREALIDQAARFHRIPAREDIAKSDLPAWMRAVVIRPLSLDWERLAREGPNWMQFWEENIRGQGETYLQANGGL
ncbi:MAG TPA: extracellular solute-binding protein [Rhodothermales bacterium]|nr:extracellular solute-binding protein [Rhodothermales bacterium]